MILRGLELVGSTSLKKSLFIAEYELFIGFVFFFDRVADHAEKIVENKSYSGIL